MFGRRLLLSNPLTYLRNSATPAAIGACNRAAFEIARTSYAATQQQFQLHHKQLFSFATTTTTSNNSNNKNNLLGSFGVLARFYASLSRSSPKKASHKAAAAAAAQPSTKPTTTTTTKTKSKEPSSSTTAKNATKIADAALDAEQKTKQQKAIEAALRMKWHLRQQKALEAKNSSRRATPSPAAAKATTTAISKNKEFRNLPVIPRVMDYINRLEAGMRKGHRRTKLQKKESKTILAAQKKKKQSELEAKYGKLFDKDRFKFFAAAKTEASLPQAVLPELAFAGRSNVGKSSLLNAITGGGKARVSDKPGTTRTLNFFSMDNRLCLVDLPGYGFAFAKEEERQQWIDLMKRFFQKRPNLKRVFILIDACHGLKSADVEMIRFLESFKSKYQIILTKTDLVEPEMLARRIYQVEQELDKLGRHAMKPVMIVSSRNSSGIQELQSFLAGFAEKIPKPEAIAAISKKKKKKAKKEAVDQEAADEEEELIIASDEEEVDDEQQQPKNKSKKRPTTTTTTRTSTKAPKPNNNNSNNNNNKKKKKSATTTTKSPSSSPKAKSKHNNPARKGQSPPSPSSPRKRNNKHK